LDVDPAIPQSGIINHKIIIYSPPSYKTNRNWRR